MKLLKRLPVLAPHSAPASATPRSHAPCQSGPRRLLSLLSGSGGLATRLATVAAATLFGLPQVQAVDYHVTTAQELQNALTSAAANGADDNIYLAAGYYTGNFNFNSTENRALLLQGEAGTTNTQITIDGAATGRDMNLANTGTGNFTVRGITFMRNCGNNGTGALRIAGGTGSSLLVDSCRFLFPTNVGASGIGLDITSGQNATLTNCVAIGRDNASGAGLKIAGVAGIVAVGGCTCATNPESALTISGAGSVSLVGNNFISNPGGGVWASASGTMTFLNNSVIGNSSGTPDIRGQSLAVAGNVFRGNGNSCGIYVAANGSCVFSNNLIANNTGGGVCSITCSGGSALAVVGNTFTGNLGSSGAGGAVGGLSLSGTAPASSVIANNNFSGNSSGGQAPNWGALACGFPAMITNNIFTGNSSPNSGGGLYCPSSSTIIGNTFIGNSAADYGGGVYFNGDVLISRNLFRQNSARLGGGGIYGLGSSMTIIDNLVTRNSQTGSGYQGAGIYVKPSSSLTMVNNTVTDNTAVGSGGGLACQVDGVTEVLNVYNNIIWGNSAAGNGPDVWLAGTGSKKTFRFNDVHGMYGVWDTAANLLDVAPAFFDPVNGDYHFRSTSPCINAGTNGAPSMPAVDLDGNIRTNGAYVDLGCYEFNNTLFHPADLNHDWVISLTEYTDYANAWKNSQAWSVAPAQIPADYVSRAGYLQNLGGTYHNDGAGAPLCWKTGP